MQTYYKPDLFEDIQLDSQQLCDDVFLYPNALKNASPLLEMIKFLENSQERSIITSGWGPWGSYGKTAFYYNNLSSSLEEEITDRAFRDVGPDILSNDEMYKRTLFELLVANMLMGLSQKIIHNFLNKNNFKVPKNSFFTRVDLCKYTFQQDGLVDGLEMPFHNDYVTGDHYLSCDKFLVSCNTYFNNDFEGAEIVFYSNGKMIEYKPCAGDVIVFPSGHPDYVSNSYCLHAVNRGSGSRYISRYFLKYHDNRDNLTNVQHLIHNEDKSVSKAYWDKRSLFGMVSAEEIDRHTHGEINEFEFEKYYKGGVF